VTDVHIENQTRDGGGTSHTIDHWARPSSATGSHSNRTTGVLFYKKFCAGLDSKQ